jgi:Zn-dependent M28 family amino/carboxypeptidase
MDFTNDPVTSSPGRNDNASGVAAVLELARTWKGAPHRKNIRLVFFVNEEPPSFQTSDMGSLVYARQLRSKHVAIFAMISLETIGYFSDAAGSQKYPALLSLFYPSRGISSLLLGILSHEV